MRSRSTLTPRSRLKTKASGFSCGARKNIITKQLHHWSIDEKGSLYNMRCTLAEEDNRRQSIHRCSGKPNVKPLGENISYFKHSTQFGDHLASALAGGQFNFSFSQRGNVAASRRLEGFQKRSRFLPVRIDACDLQERKVKIMGLKSNRPQVDGRDNQQDDLPN